MGKEAEVIPECEQGIFMDSVPSFIIKIGKYPSVFPKQPVNISDEIVCITVHSVVVIVPALVGAEFFICATTDRVATVETFLFHSTNVLIKIQKNVFKRIQTTLID